MKPLPRIALFVLFWCSLNAAGFADELSAGVSRVEITPPVGHPMGGYANRQGPSTGVHDLRSFPSERVVTVARERRLANHVLIAVTHNHSGPLTWEDQSWPGGGRSWFAETEQKILSAIEDAAGKMFPARIAAGFGEIYLGHNRRRVGPDGKVTMLWRNAEKSPTGPLDSIVGVMRIDDATGTPRAIIVN